MHTNKPVLLTSAALAAAGLTTAGVAVGASVPTASRSAAKPVVHDLDADLVNGRTLVVTAEARHATRVTFTYRGTKKTARLDPDDANDRDKDYVARFTAAAGDRRDGKRIAVKVRATNGSKATTRTLHDRVDVEEDGD